MSRVDEIREISDKFYTALNCIIEGDAAPMADVWSHMPQVTTMHPIGGRQVGWDRVQESWRQVAGALSGGWVRRTDQIIQIDGDLAYELCTEQGQVDIGKKQILMQHRATNIYRSEDGAWKMVHHHSDVSIPMMQALKDLQTEKAEQPAIG